MRSPEPQPRSGPHRASNVALLVGLHLALTACTVPNPNLEQTSDGSSSGATASTGGSSGTDTTGSGAGSATGATGTDTGAAPCAGPDALCAAPAPRGWTGPYALIEGAGQDTVACPDGWGPEQLRAWSDLSAPPAVCDCACGPPQGAACEDFTDLRQYNVLVCGMPLKSWTIDTGCTTLSGITANNYWSTDVPKVTGGACTPAPQSQVPDTTWGATVIACAPPPATGQCPAGESCVQAAPSPATLCIVAEGQPLCPVGSPYQDRRVRHRAIQDTRACEPCTCGAPQGSCPDAQVRLVSDNPCGGAILLASVQADGSCQNANATGVMAATFSPGAPQSTCTPSPPTPTGEATPTHPVTLCCL